MSRKASGSKNASLKSQVLLAMGSVLFLFALVLGFFFYAAAFMPGQDTGAAKPDTASIQAINQLQNTLAEAQQVANTFFLTNDKAQIEKHKVAANKLVNQATKFKQNSAKQGNKGAVSAANKIVNQAKQYMATFQQVAQTSIKRGDDMNGGLRGQLNAAGQTLYSIVERNDVSGPALAVIELQVQQEDYLRTNRTASLQNLLQAIKKLERIAREIKIDTLEAQLLRKSVRNYSSALDRYQAVSLATNDPNLSSTLGKEQSRQANAVRSAANEIHSIIARVNVPDSSTLAADVRRTESDFLLYRDDKFYISFQQALAALIKAYNTSSILQSHKEELIKASVAYRQAFASLVENEKKIRELTVALNKSSSALFASISAAGETSPSAQGTTSSPFTVDGNLFILIAAGAGLVVILIGFFVALVLGNSIATPLASITQILQRIIRDEDFSVEIPVTSKNEIGALAKELNNLLGLQGEVKPLTSDATESLSANLYELSELATSLDTSLQNFAEQSAKISQAVAIDDEIGVSAEDSLNSITAAAENIIQEKDQAIDQSPGNLPAGILEKVNQSVDSTRKGIQNITDVSSQISDVIQQSADLAEQTNLLALNASVKAARVGSHGREFSAIADEISQLAKRSEELSKEAKELTETLSEGIHESVSVGDDVKSTLNNVLESGGTTEKTFADFTTETETILKATDELTLIISSLTSAIREVATTAQEQIDECDTARVTAAALLAKTSGADESKEEPNIESETDESIEDTAAADDIAISGDIDEEGQDEDEEQDEASAPAYKEYEENK